MPGAFQTATGYDSMAAWDRFRCFGFHDQVRERLVALEKPRIPRSSSSRRRGAVWYDSIDINKAGRQTFDREEVRPPLSHARDRVPPLNSATSSWSPPLSPGSLSSQSSPANSIPSSPQGDGTNLSTPLSPRSPSDATQYADKVFAAACAGDVDHIDFLFTLGASVHAPSPVEGLYEAFKPAKPGHLSPCAGAAGNGQLPVVRHLLARGAHLNPPVSHSSSSPLHEACRNDEYEVAAFLLKVGADVNLNNAYNSTPLMYAVKYGSPMLVRLILSYHPDLNMLSFIGAAVIHWAVWPGRTDVLELLLVAGADVNHSMLNGYTPLHCAAVGGQFEIAQCLLYHGADHMSRDQDFQTPLDLAERNGHGDIAEMIRSVTASSRCG
nr:histone-lysine n-methyltransferase ehmt1 [Quercus suber]